MERKLLNAAKALRTLRKTSAMLDALLDVALNASIHDIDHLEQIMRCLPQYR